MGFQKPKKIVVLGATGAQGGGLVRALSLDPGFSITAITRDPNSEKAKSFATFPNVTVERADFGNVESLQSVFEGAYGVFAVTKELAQARAIAEAAKRTGVQHVVWSTLEHTPSFGARDSIPSIELDGATYKVPHFDAKGLGDTYFTELKVPTTFLRVSFFLDNFINMGMGPKNDASGNFKLILPMKEDTKLPVIAACDIGGCAAGIFKDPKNIGKTIGIAGDIVTGPEIANAISNATGTHVAYSSVSADEYRAFGFPGSTDLGNMFQWQEENNESFCGRRDVALANELNPKLLDLKGWCFIYAKEIPMAEREEGKRYTSS